MMKLLLLHGALGAAAHLDGLAAQLNDNYEIISINFSGHGSSAIDNDPFSIPLFAQEVLNFLSENEIEKISVLGYSMGGYVAMYLAKNYPDKIEKIITLATKYNWDEATAAKEVKMLDSEKILQKIPAYAHTLEKLHTGIGWQSVLQKTAEMMLAMGADNPLKAEDYRSISSPCLLMLGDKDKMVSLDETVTVYKTLPDAQLCVLPATAHPIEQLDTILAATIVRRFLNP